jgi:RNA polymerase sigma-70 factor, ECF subfamily
VPGVESTLSSAQQPALSGAAAPDEGSAAAKDLKLVAALVARDRKAAAEFVSRYTDRIYGYVYARLLPHTEQAEDLVQEVFLAAWQRLQEFRGQASLEAWLLGIARHKLEDHYRARLRKLVPLEDESSGAADPAVLPDWDQKLDDERVRERTWQVLAALPEHYRIVLLWRYWEKCPAQEMSARTGKTEKAIERLLARARSLFRREWQNG